MKLIDFSNRLTPGSSLKIISNLLVNKIQTVIDVGVQYQTKCLVDTFPEAFHYLFEPAICYHDALVGLYSGKNIKHELVPMAVSNLEGLSYQHIIAKDSSGSATHTQLLPQANHSAFGSTLLSIHETKVTTLDQYFSNTSINGPYLVKIDVDGIEEKIIAGAAKIIQGATIVMLESPLSLLSQRIALLQELKHKLFDIVGLAYYYDQLHQCDIITISKETIASNIRLRPWEQTPGQVDWSKWKSID